MSDVRVDFEMHAREYELEHRRNDVLRYKRHLNLADHRATEHFNQYKGKDKPKDYDKWLAWHQEQVRVAHAVHTAVKTDYSKRLREYTAWKRMLKATGVT